MHKLPTKKVKQISLSFSLTAWEHSLFSSLSKHFILPCFHLGIQTCKVWELVNMDFLTQKCCDRTSKRIRLELYDKRTEIRLAFQGIFVCFEKLICLFNFFMKFATVRRRPREAAVSSSAYWMKSLRTSRRSVTRNHRSGLSFAIRQSSCLADGEQ